MQSPQTRRRGRPCTEPSESPEPTSPYPGVAFAARVIRKGQRQMQTPSISSLSVMDRVRILAAREFDDAGTSGVSKLLKVSASAADSLIVGSKPVTDKVLISAVRDRQISGHWLLTGEGQRSSEPSEPSGELAFIQAMRKLDEYGALLILFLLNFGALLNAVPGGDRFRLLASVHRVTHDESTKQALSARLGESFVYGIRENVAESMYLLGVDAEQLSAQPLLLTPLHEILGVFGPEQGGSLMSMLAD